MSWSYVVQGHDATELVAHVRAVPNLPKSVAAAVEQITERFVQNDALDFKITTYGHVNEVGSEVKLWQGEGQVYIYVERVARARNADVDAKTEEGSRELAEQMRDA